MITCLPRSLRTAPLALVLLLVGCSLFGGSSRSVLLPVSDVQAPASAQVGVPFTVTLRIDLYNGCVSFSELEAVEAPARLTLTARGREESSGACDQSVRTIEQEYRYTPSSVGEVTVDVVGRGETASLTVAVE